MIIRVTLKDPDTMHDAVERAVKEYVETMDGLDAAEKDVLAAGRTEQYRGHISSKWMEWGEYLTVEFDTTTGTAIVIENGN